MCVGWYTGDLFWYSFVWQTKEYKSFPDEIGILMAGQIFNPFRVADIQYL
jgi:hypothetical protein